jgi:hypothetical protein
MPPMSSSLHVVSAGIIIPPAVMVRQEITV